MAASMKLSSHKSQTKELSVGKLRVGKSFALQRNSQLCGFLSKWLDFALENLPNNSKCDYTFSQNTWHIFEWQSIEKDAL